MIYQRMLAIVGFEIESNLTAAKSCHQTYSIELSPSPPGFSVVIKEEGFLLKRHAEKSFIMRSKTLSRLSD